jgi:hypothetical protein
MTELFSFFMRTFVLKFKITLGVQFGKINFVHRIVHHKTQGADCDNALNVQDLRAMQRNHRQLLGREETSTLSYKYWNNVSD